MLAEGVHKNLIMAQMTCVAVLLHAFLLPIKCLCYLCVYEPVKPLHRRSDHDQIEMSGRLGCSMRMVSEAFFEPR